MRFALLGPVAVTAGSVSVAIPGGLRRALLAYLLLHRDRAVDVAALTEALWGGAAPPTARAQLQAAVSALRRVLKEHGGEHLIVSQAGGYRAAVAADALDLARFESMLTAARHAERSDRLTEAVTMMRDALALWRGPALLGATGAFVEQVRARLADQRLGTLEDVIELELRLGRQASVIGELTDLVQHHPLRERLCGQLMLALHRTGRSAEAVAAYRALRGRLRDELGLDPGRNLDELAGAILRGDPGLQAPGPPAPGVPAEPPQVAAPVEPPRPGRPTQLPGDGGHFTGRDAELAAIDRALAAEGRIVVVTGSAGAGKTALAVRWGHRNRHHFPDGQLFLDLAGHTGTGARPVFDALGYLLRSLGAAPDGIPAEQTERVAAYRSAVADRRLLIILDNAADGAQVEPLLPATAGCAVLVTSRYRLDALAVRHAVQPIRLDVLPRDHAVRLFREVLGAPRVQAEAGSADRLAELCGDLPLALRIVAARLLVRPELALRELTAELDDVGRRLSGLGVPGDAGVRAALQTSYRTLRPPAARTLRLLSAHPGPSFTAAHAAALTGRSYDAAAADLDELAAVHLLVDRPGGRFGMHDLIRLYAGELCAAQDSPPERQAAADRLVDWYLRTADAANRIVSPHRSVGSPTISADLPATPVPATEPEAFAWFDAERDGLVAVIADRHAAGADRPAQQLGYLFSGYIERRMSHAHELATLETAARAAGRVGDDLAEASALATLAVGYAVLRRYDEALRHFGRAQELFERSGDRRRASSALGNMAIIRRLTGRYTEAVRILSEIRAERQESGDHLNVGLSCTEIGNVYLDMGEVDTALAEFRRAVRECKLADNRPAMANALVGVAWAAVAAGDAAAADAAAREAEQLAAQAGARHAQGLALALAGEVAKLGAPPEAAGGAGDEEVLSRLRQAHQIFLDTADQHEAAVVGVSIGQLLIRAGRPAAAREALQAATAARAQLPDALEEGRLEQAWGDLAAQDGDLALARQHWSRSDARYAAAHSARARALRASLPSVNPASG